MDKWLLFPALAITATAQQTTPVPTEAEKAVRARAEQFYQMELDKHFRQMEDTLVAEDSRDVFYNAGKPDIKGFTITSVELTDNDTHAKVTARVKSEVMFPGAGLQVLELPAITSWQLENGQWYWHVAPQAPVQTPFGEMTPKPSAEIGNMRAFTKIPDVRSLEALVTVSSEAVTLTEAEPVQTVTISNAMAGPIGVQVSPEKIEGVTVELEKKQINAGETAALRFRLTGASKTSGQVRVTCSPLGQEFVIQVVTK